MKYTTGRHITDDPFHIEIIREKLMRTLQVVLPDVIDELNVAIPDNIPFKDSGRPRSAFLRQGRALICVQSGSA